MSGQAVADAGPEPTRDASELHRQFDELHDLIYARGGIRPVNAAIEELSKLVLLEAKLIDEPEYEVPGRGRLRDILDPAQIIASKDVADVKHAFRHIASLPEFAGRLPGDGSQAIWPHDEPLRINRSDVVAEACRILRQHLDGSGAAQQFDVIGTAFDVFLRGRYDHSGGLGTHLTPHTVATHLAQICLSDMDLLGTRARGPLVGDPCCGTGRFLVAALQETVNEFTDHPNVPSFIERGLFGADQSMSAVAKARINLLLFGVRRPNVFTVEDSITDAHVDELRGTLRLILTNPPFGDAKYDNQKGIQRASMLLPSLRQKRRVDPALAFVVRCIELLCDGGRLGIVLPDGLVDGPVLRDALLGSSPLRMREISVEANISLPKATFSLAGTVAKTSAVVIRRQAATHGHVFIARVEHVGFVKQGSRSVTDPAGDDLPKIAHEGQKALAGSLDVENGVTFVSRSPLAAIVKRGEVTSLDPARFDPAAVSARTALGTKSIALRELLDPVRRKHNTDPESCAFISVLHINDLGAVAWHDAREHRPSTPGLAAEPEDLIFALINPRKLRATVIPADQGSVLCSSEFGVFEAKADPYEVLLLLHHPLVRAQIVPLGRGTSSSRRRITSKDLLDVLVPALPHEKLCARAAEIRRSLSDVRQASIQAAAAYTGVASLGPDPE